MAIAKTTVSHTLVDPSLDPVQRAGTIVLGGFINRQWRNIQGMSTDGQIITSIQVDADVNGDWSVDLVPNVDVVFPENTLYRYLPASGDPVVFAVPQGGPEELLDIIVTDPGNWPVLTPTVVGPQGESLEFDWQGTQLGVRVGSSGPYTYVDLEGPQGVQGDKGDTGDSLEFDWNGTQLGVRVEGDPTYTYVDLEGPQGDLGPGLEFQWDGTGKMLGVRPEGSGASWDYSSDLTGPTGAGSGDVIGPGSSTDSNVAVFDGGTGKKIKDGGPVPTATSATPEDLGTAAVGSSSEFARADHVHNMPTATDVGARASNWVPDWGDVTSKPKVIVDSEGDVPIDSQQVVYESTWAQIEPGVTGVYYIVIPDPVGP